MVLSSIIQAVFYCYYVNDRMITEDDIAASLSPAEMVEHLSRLAEVFPHIQAFMLDNEGQVIDVTTCTDILVRIQQIPYPTKQSIDHKFDCLSVKELKRSFGRLIEAYNFWKPFVAGQDTNILSWLKEQFDEEGI